MFFNKTNHKMAQIGIAPYFSWVVDKLLAVSALPYHHTHLNYFAENGIQTIVSISDDIEPPFHYKQTLKVIRMNTVSTRAPSLNECMYIVSLIENAKRRGEVTILLSRLLTRKSLRISPDIRKVNDNNLCNFVFDFRRRRSLPLILSF